MDPASEMKMDELARRSGVPARTIRLYIARGLVPTPLRTGRGAVYGPEHLASLERIREGQRRGLTLEQIRHEAAGPPTSETPLPAPEAWWTYDVAHDVRVQVRANATGRRLKQIRDALSTLQALL